MSEKPKPADLLALHEASAELFDLLRQAFDLPTEAVFDVSSIDAAKDQMQDVVQVATWSLRKLQALRYISTAGVATSLPAVVGVAQDLLLTVGELVERLPDGAQHHAEAMSALVDQMAAAAFHLIQLDPGGEEGPVTLH